MATIRDKMGHCLHEFFTMPRSREQAAVLGKDCECGKGQVLAIQVGISQKPDKKCG